MRIAYVYGSTPLRHGEVKTDMLDAVENYSDWVGETAYHIAELGHEVHIFIMHKHLQGEVVYKKVNWHSYKPIITHKKLIAGKEPSYAMQRDVFKIRPDIIHFQTASYCINYALYVLLSRLKNIPIVGQHHGGLLPRHWWDLLTQRYAMRNNNATIFLTKDARDLYLNKHGLKEDSTRIIPVGYSKIFKKIEKDKAREITGLKGAPVILWVAFLQRRKNPMLVIDAFRDLVEEFPEARLYMIGSGEMEAAITDMISRDADLKGRVIMKGFIPNNELPQYMSASDIYVLASDSEGFGISVVEAMACGNAPVLTDLPSFRGITDDGKCGMHFPANDKEALKDSIRKLIKDKMFLQELSARAEQRAKFYTWESTAKNLVKAYRKVIDGCR